MIQVCTVPCNGLMIDRSLQATTVSGAGLSSHQNRTISIHCISWSCGYTRRMKRSMRELSTKTIKNEKGRYPIQNHKKRKRERSHQTIKCRLVLFFCPVFCPFCPVPYGQKIGSGCGVSRDCPYLEHTLFQWGQPA